jgi:hypothetical protein
MPWVRFSEDFIFTPDEDRRGSVKYRAGYVGLVRQQCADKAIRAGRAKLTTKPKADA